MLGNIFIYVPLVVAGSFIGGNIEENGRVSFTDIKDALMSGVGITFTWLIIWGFIGLVVVVIGKLFGF